MKIKSVVTRTMVFVLAAAALAAGCTSMFENRDFAVVSFEGGECLSTKAPEGNYTEAYVKVGTLKLQSKGGNLAVTLSGLRDNCSIKEGFDCRAMVEGSFVYVYVTAKSESAANCICEVGDIETELSGLENSKYTLVYNYKSSTKDITQEVPFEFSLLLNKKVDFEQHAYFVY